MKSQRDRSPPRPARAVIDSVTFESTGLRPQCTWYIMHHSPWKPTDWRGMGGKDKRRDEPVHIRTSKRKEHIIDISYRADLCLDSNRRLFFPFPSYTPPSLSRPPFLLLAREAPPPSVCSPIYHIYHPPLSLDQ